MVREREMVANTWARRRRVGPDGLFGEKGYGLDIYGLIRYGQVCPLATFTIEYWTKRTRVEATTTE